MQYYTGMGADQSYCTSSQRENIMRIVINSCYQQLVLNQCDKYLEYETRFKQILMIWFFVLLIIFLSLFLILSLTPSHPLRRYIYIYIYIYILQDYTQYLTAAWSALPNRVHTVFFLFTMQSHDQNSTLSIMNIDDLKIIRNVVREKNVILSFVLKISILSCFLTKGR